MLPEARELINEVAKLAPEQQGPYQTWLVIHLVRDVAYYAAAAIVAIALGRRMINAILIAYRESRRERA